MSKLTKLIRHPKQFFSDAAKKRTDNTTNMPINKVPAVAAKKRADKTTNMPINKVPAVPINSKTFDVSRLNVVMSSRVLLHSGEGEPGKAHMRMWIESFEDAGVPFAVLTRLPVLHDFVKKNWPRVSVALAASAPDVEKIVNSLPHLTTVFYPSHTGNNIHLLRFNHLAHVFIGHGDSDKSGSAHKFFRAYDQVWTAGEAHIDRFRNTGINFGHLEFVKVGRPALLPIAKIVEQSIPEMRRAMLKRPVILYLPTWEGTFEEQNYSSLGLSGEILKAANTIGNRGSVLVKIHPMTGQRNTALKSADSQLLQLLKEDRVVCEIIDRSEPLDQHLLRANVFICDNSAVITECLAVDAPIFVYRPQGEHLRFTQSAMPPDHFAYVFSNIDEFAEKFELFMSEGDTLAQKRSEARQYLLGIEETRANRFADEVRRLAGLATRAEQTPTDSVRVGGVITMGKQQ